MPEGDPLGSLLLTVLLIGVNAFFAMSEMAVISFNDVKLKRLAEEGDKKAKILCDLTDEESRFLSTIQVGVTFAGFFSSAVAADNLTEYVVYWLRNTGIPAAPLRALSLVIITLLLSFITLIFGELVPKRIAMNNPEKMSFFAAYPLKFVSTIAYPIVKLLSITTNGVLRLIGIDPNAQNPDVTEEGIRMMLDAGEEEGTIEEDESEMIHNIFDLGDTEVTDIMTHRTELITVDVDDDISKIISLALEEGHSRFPVCDKSVDKIIGMVHVKDLLVITQEKKKTYKLKDFIREVLYVPESMMVKNAFEKMRLEKIQLAVVIDEYGGTAGIITMEDILESIVGDIEDEYDEEEEDINLMSDGVYTLDGTADLEDVADELNITLPEDSEDYDTIGGYLTSILGRFPEEGETVELDAMGYHFKVLSVTDHHMDEIEATKLPDTAEIEED
ncbi:MAG: HlyC/CorC family transporter [Oscillospiraceae bacterium]|nr:HlyC/CorC family transporter [Oscillospiraceae bacterium]